VHESAKGSRLRDRDMPPGVVGGEVDQEMRAMSTSVTRNDSTRSNSSNVSWQSSTPRGGSSYEWGTRFVKSWGTQRLSVMAIQVAAHRH